MLLLLNLTLAFIVVNLIFLGEVTGFEHPKHIIIILNIINICQKHWGGQTPNPVAQSQIFPMKTAGKFPHVDGCKIG